LHSSKHQSIDLSGQAEQQVFERGPDNGIPYLDSMHHTIFGCCDLLGRGFD
jgi:hypothetical protein